MKKLTKAHIIQKQYKILDSDDYDKILIKSYVRCSNLMYLTIKHTKFYTVMLEELVQFIIENDSLPDSKEDIGRDKPYKRTELEDQK